MKLVNTVCPNCGSVLKIDPYNKRAICEYCDTEFLIDDEGAQSQYYDAEEAGYRFEKGRQRALEEEMFDNSLCNDSYDYEPVKERRTWLWILGWLFAFPIPATILIMRKEDMEPRKKYAIIFAIWVVYFLIGAPGII